jgi:hypothetical protein
LNRSTFYLLAFSFLAAVTPFRAQSDSALSALDAAKDAVQKAGARVGSAIREEEERAKKAAMTPLPEGKMAVTLESLTAGDTAPKYQSFGPSPKSKDTSKLGSAPTSASVGGLAVRNPFAVTVQEEMEKPNEEERPDAGEFQKLVERLPITGLIWSPIPQQRMVIMMDIHLLLGDSLPEFLGLPAKAYRLTKIEMDGLVFSYMPPVAEVGGVKLDFDPGLAKGAAMPPEIVIPLTFANPPLPKRTSKLEEVFGKKE